MTLEEMLLLTYKREPSFRLMLDYLKNIKDPLICETGCCRLENNFDGDGMSTLIFDRFINDFSGKLISVDISDEHVDFAKSTVSDKTEVICSDSVLYFHNNKPGKIDLLYLDSMDYDYDNPDISPIHHLFELTVLFSSLQKGSMLCVDDNLESGEGKGKFIRQFLSKLGIEPIYDGYQVIWLI